ncbi:Hint domain-containing protein [Epibacterium ulvae]|uniref:Hint domain-containing protein n=1 Tax=Epibacterium ulvae TaxID=1156985 RepID=UPI001BFCBF1E|nr:Hint domain-containing protein [Epibacterium ulvae]MBT8153770.1 Hint domain-containing protein [Epibacterium ulvae]
MAILFGNSPTGSTITVTGSIGSVLGDPSQQDVTSVSGVLGTAGVDLVSISGNSNLFNGVSVSGGNDVVTISDTFGAQVALGAGDNTFTLTDSTLYGVISSEGGDDAISLLDSTASGGIASGAGNDTIQATSAAFDQIGGLSAGDGADVIRITGVTVNTRFETGDGADAVELTDTTINAELDTGDGDDTISAQDSTLNRGLDSGDGDDLVEITGSTVNNGLLLGDGSDTLLLSSSVLNNGLNAGDGDDRIALTDDVTIFGRINGGDGTDHLSLPVGTEINDRTLGRFTIEEGGDYTLSQGRLTLPGGHTIRYSNLETASTAPCFVAGTLIDTPRGATAVEALRIGDLVETIDQGAQPIRWIGSRLLTRKQLDQSPKLRPVLIPTGALGTGCPARDLYLSPQHRVLVKSKIAQRMFGTDEVLVAAIKLVGHAGIQQIRPQSSICYTHVLLDQHHLLQANGTVSETLLLGQEALRALSEDADHCLALLAASGPVPAAQQRATDAARLIPEQGKRIKTLLRRHQANGKPLQASLQNQVACVNVAYSHLAPIVEDKSQEVQQQLRCQDLSAF